MFTLNGGRCYSEGLVAWALDVAEGDEDIAGELLNRFEKEVNEQLPNGSYIDMERCEPVNLEDWEKHEDEDWEKLINKVAHHVEMGLED